MNPTYIYIGLGVAIGIWISSYLLGYANGRERERKNRQKVKDTGRIGAKIKLKGRKEVSLYDDEKLQTFSCKMPKGVPAMIISRFKVDMDADKYDSFEIESKHKKTYYTGWVSASAVYEK